MAGYTSGQVQKMLGLSASQVRAYVRAGFLSPERGARGELRFTFQDLVLLRTARGLLAAEVPPVRVRRALERLKEQLPEGQPLTGVHIRAEGKRILVREGNAVWQPESGQAIFDFDVAELARAAEPLFPRAVPEPIPQNAEKKKNKRKETQTIADDDQPRDADGWYQRGCELEEAAPDEARAAYRRAIAIQPGHAEAHVNLGRLLHDAGDPAAAEEHYRRGLASRPDDVTAAFNLGVALEDLGRFEDAARAYESAVAIDGGFADAHFNLSRLCERLGRRAAALRHLQTYRKLTRG